MDNTEHSPSARALIFALRRERDALRAERDRYKAIVKGLAFCDEPRDPTWGDCVLCDTGEGHSLDCPYVLARATL